MAKEEMNKRETFSNRMAFVLASIGGAVGLGNVWKFPYITGQHGGAAFIVVYLIALLVIASPVLMTEFGIGRLTGTSYTSVLKKLFPGKSWYLVGILGVIALILTLGFYAGIAGWTIAYIFKSVTGSYAGHSAAEIGQAFGSFISSPFQVIFWLLVMIAITAFIVSRGLAGGIEKICNILLPALFLLIIILAIRAVTLPGAAKGLEFYLKPNFSSLTKEAIMAAIGQAFFSLGVGTGNLVIYGSYLKKDKTIGSSTIMVALGDTLAAILFGFIVFPAVFAYNIDSTIGPPLVFITLPTIFAQMKFGMFFATIFFVLLFFACLTSTICIMEAIVGYFTDEIKMSRKKSTVLTTAIVTICGIVMMLSFGVLGDILIFGKIIFDFANDILVSTVLLPLGGILVLVIAGWAMNTKELIDEINTGEGYKVGKGFEIVIKFIAPIAVLLMFLQSIGLF